MERKLQIVTGASAASFLALTALADVYGYYGVYPCFVADQGA